MTTGWTPTPAVAALLSALLPGLGQLCCRQWGRGAAFMAGAIGVDAGLDVTASMMAFVRTGVVPSSRGQFLIGTLIAAGLAVWSMLDARRTAINRT